MTIMTGLSGNEMYCLNLNKTEMLPVQAIIRGKDTWISNDDLFSRTMAAEKGGGE